MFFSMKRSLVVFVALGLLAGLVGCSDSSDEIAEIRAELDDVVAELDTAKAELEELTAMKEEYPDKEGYKDKEDGGLLISYEETVDFFTICFTSGSYRCGELYSDVLAMRRLVPNDQICRAIILMDAIEMTELGWWNSEFIRLSRHNEGPDNAYLFDPPSCAGFDRADTEGYSVTKPTSKES